MEDSYLVRALQFFEFGRFEDSMINAKYALEQNPENLEAKKILVRCFLETDNIEQAEDLNSQLIASYPDQDDLFFNASRIFWEKDQKEKAKIAIDTSLSLNPYEPSYFGYKGFMYLESKDYLDSLKNADEGLKIDPNHVLCLNVRAQALTKLKRNTEAEESIQNTLQQDPEGSFSHANVGWVLLEQGHHTKARHHFEQALKNDPNSRFAKDGMLESIKAKNVIYRMFLKYAFWVSNLKGTQQWIFIVGLYIAYRILVSILQKTPYPYLAYAVIVPYLIFALGGWIINPFSNAILLFNNYSKYLLDKYDRISGILFVGLLIFSSTCALLFWLYKDPWIFLMAISGFCSIIPISKAPLLDKTISKAISFLIGIAILTGGCFGSFFGVATSTLFLFTVFGLVAYTWLGNMLK